MHSYDHMCDKIFILDNASKKICDINAIVPNVTPHYLLGFKDRNIILDVISYPLTKFLSWLPGGVIVQGLIIWHAKLDETSKEDIIEKIHELNAIKENLKSDYEKDQISRSNFVIKLLNKTDDNNEKNIQASHWFRCMDTSNLTPLELQVVSIQIPLERPIFSGININLGEIYNDYYLIQVSAYLESPLSWIEDAFLPAYINDALNVWITKLDSPAFYLKTMNGAIKKSIQNGNAKIKLFCADIYEENYNDFDIDDLYNGNKTENNEVKFTKLSAALQTTGRKALNQLSSTVPVLKIEKIATENTEELSRSTRGRPSLNGTEGGDNDECKSAAKIAILRTHLDVLYYFAPRSTGSEIALALQAKLVHQLKETRDRLQDCDPLPLSKRLDELRTKSDTTTPVLTLYQHYHFWPRTGELNFPITLAYDSSLDDAKLGETRKTFHKAFSISPCKPMFTRSNAIKHFNVHQPMFFDGKHLVNPHNYMKDPALHNKVKAPNKKQFPSENFPPSPSQKKCVKELYAFYHYGQDGTNDSGWGCAYRSFQTVASWFIMQSYVAAMAPTNSIHATRPPNHLEIQKALHEMGDKNASFVGSSQWIGSNEVSYALQHFYKIDSRILHLRSGSEMNDHINTFLYHFESQGTPIMIGGGALAHTILGVEYDPMKEEVKYLILDPHYTGPDDITSILKEGGCYWKNAKFWEASKFYNLCLPQRPIVC